MQQRITLSKLQQTTAPLVCVATYSAPMARLCDRVADILLVGDSVGMVVYGLNSTVHTTMSMMINHGAAVVRGSARAFVVVDMPFASYQQSPQQAFVAAAQILQETGCHAVKLEGGRVMAETIRFLVDRGIPVMGHIGLTPQAVHQLGGYRVQGKTVDASAMLVEDAKAVAAAGAFAIVLEGTQRQAAEQVVQAVDVPVIGIGASPACAGQVLVLDDLAGLSPPPHPRFVQCYADGAGLIQTAVTQFASEVRSGAFPAPAHCY